MQDANVADRALSQTVVELVFLILISVFFLPQLHAQVVGGTIQGTASDASGAVLTGVKVSILNLQTNTSNTVLTNSSGFYALPNLLPGTYELSASAAGFSTTVLKNIEVTVGDQVAVNLTLKVGAISETVEVAALSPQVDLASSAIRARTPPERPGLDPVGHLGNRRQ